jgi:DNA ligase-1
MDRLAEVCDRVAAHASRNRKVEILAEYLRKLPEEDLIRAVNFISGRPFGATDPRKLSAGYAALRQAIMDVTGWGPETLRICFRTVGDGGEAIGLLLHYRTEEAPLSLAEAEAYFESLEQSRKAQEKIQILKGCFSRHRPNAVKYFVKVIGGDLRIGLQAKMVEEAVAAATGIPHSEIQAASNRSGELGAVALAARRGELHTIEASLFHPMEFMLAKPLDSLGELEDPENWIVEDKYDGIRAQVHAADGRVAIYSRGMEDVTGSFPEVLGSFRRIRESVVVDGEILAWKDGRALHFNLLQQRIARKVLEESHLSEIPIGFMAYDLMYLGDHLVLDDPIEERRRLLESLGLPLLSPWRTAGSREEVDKFFEEARERSNEGLVLKRRGSFYEPGRRSGTWLKLKRPFATLDVVVTAAEQGHGKRATVLSDYTFAVLSGEEFVNVGKAYSGLTDKEIWQLTQLFRSLAVERYGRSLLVKPQIVLEVAFDGVQKSPRHKSGYALRFPRILRWRHDKRPSECDTVERVRELYERSMR